MTGSIRFGEWVWNPNTLELRNGADVATLEPRVARLLEYLVTHPGELMSHDRIIEAVWDGRIVSDEAVRRAVFSLRQALAVDGAESYIRTIHKKGYVAAFPPPVAVEPVLPDTPAIMPIPGTKPPETVLTTIAAVTIDVDTAPLPTSRRRLWLGGAVALIALIALVATVLAPLEMPLEQPPATHTEVPAQAPATLAVLPFVNFSKEEVNELLANGLTEELFGALERNRELRVTARSSAFQFKDKNRDIREVGQRLDVRYVLSGSVRSSADNVQVHAELLDIDTGAPLWSETYNRALADWFTLQQDIAMEVAHAVQRVLQKEVAVVAVPGRVSNAEAQLELLRARQLLITRSVADAEEAIEHLQRALTLDPNYALAYARLADAILIQAESTTGIKAARPVVAPLLEKALVLDPGLGEAYALRSMLTDDPVAAEHDLRRGLELNPSYARGYELLARLQTGSLPLSEKAIESIDTAIALDPLTPGNFHAKANLMMGPGKWREAVELDRRALDLNPNYRGALMQLSQVYAIEGYFADAIGYARRAVALDPRAVTLRHNLMWGYLAVGDVEAARAVSNPDPPFGNWALLWAEGKEAQVVDTIYSGQPIPKEGVDPMIGSHILLRQAVSDGDYARALAVTNSVLPAEYTLPPNAIMWALYPYANVMQLLEGKGDTVAASRLKEQLEKRMADMEAQFPRHRLIHEQVRAILRAREGRSEEACAALEFAYTPNPRPLWRVIVANPAFDSMRTAACFEALNDRIEKYIATERARIDTMRRDGKIPDRSTAKPDRAAGVET
jgi:TolB-like protein/DNA-binding winged helix-turn-helix (wHTH) protein